MTRACSIAALLTATLGGCSSNVGSINITVVTAPVGMQVCSSPGVCTPVSSDAGPDSGAVAVDPFADVTTIRVTVTGPDLVMEVERPIKARAAGLEEVPVGPDRQIMVEGLDSQGVPLMRGRTVPFEVQGTLDLKLYVGPVDRFSYINTKQLTVARAFHTATLLRDDRVLLTGGVTGERKWTPVASGAQPAATSAAEVIESNALQTTATKAMIGGPRMAHTATLTAKGNVLVAGGAAPTDAGPPPDVSTDASVPPDSAVMDSAVDLSDGPAPDAPSDAGPSDAAQSDVAQPDAAQPDAASKKDTAKPNLKPVPLVGLVEFFDPANNKFSKNIEMLNVPRHWHGAAGTPSSVVLVGGASEDSEAIRLNELYRDGRLNPINMNQARRAPTVVVLKDGRVMVSGGLDRNGQPLRSIELWTPGGVGFTSADPMGQPRAFHTATVLDSGEVLLVGGLTSMSASLSASGTVELFDPKTKKVTSLSTFTDAQRWAHTATRLDNGDVLVAGGYRPTTDDWVPNTGAVLIEVAKNHVLNHSKAQPMNEARAGHTATLLRTGAVLITGGRSGCCATSDTAEVYIY
jgi:Galactose oxidase, central domain